MTDLSTPKLIVSRCCTPGNAMGCTLWRVSDGQGIGLGRFGTKTGALDFAHGRINARNLVAIREITRRPSDVKEVTLETILEVEE